MNSRKVKVIKPSFYDSFSCIGTSCTDNCCHTWQITVDKEHFLLYKQTKDEKFRDFCNKNIVKNENATDQAYATIKMDKKNVCAFQDTDGGCKIYRTLGKNTLCLTCSSYPRRRAQFNYGTWEISLSMSCEEAVRLGVFQNDRVEFECEEKEFNENDDIFSITITGIGKNGTVISPPLYGNALRDVCMKLIKCRKYTIGERILSIGLLLRRIDKMLTTNPAEAIIAMSEQYFISVNAGEFKGFFERLDYDEKAHISAFRLPVSHILAGFRKNIASELLSLISHCCTKDNISGEYQINDDAVKTVLDLVKKNGADYFAENDTVIENYFVNYLFSAMFPFLYITEGLSYEETGIMLAEQYALLRIIFALIVERDGKSQNEQMLKAIVTLARSSQHTDLGNDVVQLIQAVKTAGIAHAAYFLR